MFENFMYGVAGITVLASFILVSPALCVVALVLMVFGLCGFYQKESR